MRDAITRACFAVAGAAAIVAMPNGLIADDRFSATVDPATAVVGTPKGFAHDDDAWRSGWLYASLVLIHAKDASLYETLKSEEGLDIASVKKYLEYFRDNCLTDEGWLRAGSLNDNFSRDQLVPMLYLLGVVHVHGPDDCKPVAKEIVGHLVKLLQNGHQLSDEPIGEVRGNLRYVIDVIGDKYDKSLVGGSMRGFYKTQFSAALRLHSLQVQAPGDLATEGDYSVFNTLALVTVLRVLKGASNDDVKDWRKNYRQHADKGWGPAFRLVSGRSLTQSEINKYRKARIKRSQDNDIVMGQRGGKYLSGEFPTPQFTQGENDDGERVLDYVILEGLRLAWAE